MTSRAAFLILVCLLTLAGGTASGADSPPQSSGSESRAPESSEMLAARELVAEIESNRLQLQELYRERDAATGERRELLDEQIWTARLADQQRIMALADNLEAQRRQGVDVSAIQEQLDSAVRDRLPEAKKRLATFESELEQLEELREEAPPEARGELDNRIVRLGQRVGDTYKLLTESLGVLESTGLELAEERSFLTSRLTWWADLLAARVQLMVRQRDQAAAQVANDPEDAAAQADLQDVETRLDRSAASLDLASDLLESLDQPVSQYRQVLIAATGEITTDILDRDVALGLLDRIGNRALDAFATGAPAWLFKTLIFVLILIGFRLISTLVQRLVGQSLKASNLPVSQLQEETLVRWSSRAVMLLGLLLALSQLGIEIGALLAGLGIAGFVLGFALQDSLSNFAAGAMILVYRPFDVDDIIEAAGVTGRVSRMTLVSTTILTFDNQTLIVPNSKIWGDVIRNVTAQQIRRVDMIFGIGYGDDVDKADAVLHDILSKNENVLDDPEPIVEVHELGDSSVNFAVRPWVQTQNYWPTYWAITREVKKRFEREGISIPFPQRDVHHYFETPPDPHLPASPGDLDRR